MSQERVMLVSLRASPEETQVIRDELPPLEPEEIRLKVDKVGVSANNRFYAQAGDQPFLKFYSVYPLSLKEHDIFANVPAWGSGTVVESRNDSFKVGEQFWGFYHMTNYVQMKARRNDDGFKAYGGLRDKINQAYNNFSEIVESSPLHGEGEPSDFATAAFPGAMSGFLLTQLLLEKDFYGGDGLILTSASSKFSVATAFLVQDQRKDGRLRHVIGFTSAKNKDFVQETGLYDLVLSYEDNLPEDKGNNNCFIDVAGNIAIYKKNKDQLCKGLVIGQTQPGTKASASSLGASAVLKIVSGMLAPKSIAKFLDARLNPKLEMFFAPTVITMLRDKWGREKMTYIGNRDMCSFVDAVVKNGWIKVNRADESLEEVQTAFKRVFIGDEILPCETVVLSLSNL
eukprot:CAMPEP_0204844266 /NCGR_PEP_ID=MMETSP1347-20130617/94_1 /ASSEMBLY_ACC=CAM_ASM_000690 /TAXON_ID=215587 /ORGANISM="Aplanochytrium stocchinoi, Strain GSBS06" /LENGTH=398 /DNA_ID=CAMNT_0051983577 /DNA_START=37 /DNA_END=1233 /DNA_ORIENTATION=-